MSSRTLRLRPQTAADIASLADACTRAAAGRGEQFIDAVDAACATLSGAPDAGADRHRHVVPELPAALRSLPVPGFEHVLLFYMSLADTIELIRVVDTSRGMEPLLEEVAA